MNQASSHRRRPPRRQSRSQELPDVDWSKNRMWRRTPRYCGRTSLPIPRLVSILLGCMLIFLLHIHLSTLASPGALETVSNKEDSQDDRRNFVEYCNAHADLRRWICGNVTAYCSDRWIHAILCRFHWFFFGKRRDFRMPLLSEIRVRDSMMKQAATTAWPGDLGNVVDSHQRVVVVIVSCAYLDMLDNVIQSMVKLDVMNFVVVPLDDIAFSVAKQLYPNNVVPPMPGIPKSNLTDQPAQYGSQAFHQLTATRPLILSAFLRRNYTLFYCDIDTVWRSASILDRLEAAASKKRYSLVLTDDSGDTQGNYFCTCYIYAKPTLENIRILTSWGNDCFWSEFGNDQYSFQPLMNLLAREEKEKILKLPANDQDIPNGHFYFQVFNQTQRDRAMIVHNNWISGHSRKKQRFQQYNLWHTSSKLGEIPYTCSPN